GRRRAERQAVRRRDARRARRDRGRAARVDVQRRPAQARPARPAARAGRVRGVAGDVRRAFAALAVVAACGHAPARRPEPEPEPAAARAPPPPDPACPPPHERCPDLGPWPYQPANGDVYVALAERGGGLARNPAYIVTIFRDGRVVYHAL